MSMMIDLSTASKEQLIELVKHQEKVIALQVEVTNRLSEKFNEAASFLTEAYKKSAEEVSRILAARDGSIN